ncbi:Chloride channel protein [Mycena sanguinolenta]|uniref:Chloride channel protein n=1 Tax=Mycena sanguinolenta TaxID=230812 RepID=A0A8H7DG30_9AGAR|nr:Chloride channel protein [Mycena sanguinolenta]
MRPDPAELFELTEDGQVPSPARQTHFASHYVDGSTIDWLREEAAERERTNIQRAQFGVRGLLLPWFDAARMWLVVILTGIGIGLTGGWLDVLVKWLGDLREGRCSYGFFYNQVTCCSGVKPGEPCTEWSTWSKFFGVNVGLAQSLLHIFVYVVLAVAFAGCAAVLVKSYAPYAFHTGIPEIKAILGGYVLTSFLTPWTLLIKGLGLALAVASGLSLGKEGPLVHVACCMAFLLSRFFKQFRNSQAQQRKLLAAAAAAGVSVAFGSPLGGVLFGLEELDTFANESEVMWRGFVASAIAAVSLQYVNPFGTSKLVLFQVTNGSDTWRAFELIPWLTLGVIGGILGSLLIKLNVEIALYRRNSVLNDWPILEVVGASAITAAISYLVVFSRVQSSELVANLFQECDPTKIDYHGLCNPTAMWENVFLLILTAVMKVLFTAWTFGMMIPAGIFLPTIAIGACLGRAVGLLTQGLHRAYPTAWIFLSCPPDPSVRCISPGFYAVIGASAMLGGVTRMTISLVVILFELTGALSHVLPIMISVMASKWVGDAFGKDGGIYAQWIALRGYPWLPPVDFEDRGAQDTGTQLMRPLERLVVIEDEWNTVLDLDTLLKDYDFHGFPVVRREEFLGFVTRDKLRSALTPLLLDDSERTKRCAFSRRLSSTEEQVDFSGLLEEAVLQLREEVPKELVVNMFQKMNLRQIVFTTRGRLTGMVTKSDVASLLNCDFPHTAALGSGVRRPWA